MSSAATTHPASASFETFPARAYIEKYYADVGPENAAMLAALTSFARDLRPCLGQVAEVGGGPMVLPILALSAACGRRPDRVVFGDIAPANLAEVRRWLTADPEAFAYSAVLEWLRKTAGVEPEALVDSVRSAHWDLRRIDWRDPLPSELEGRFDTISSHYFAESATNDPVDFERLLTRVGQLAAPGAALFLSFIAGSNGYAVGDHDYPAVPLDPEGVLKHLAGAGVSLDHVRLHGAPTDVDPVESGYEGLIFLAGRLQRR
jgi:hypothetical protein